MENSNLWWETIRYFPQILFSIEPAAKSLRSSLLHDISHFHYFLESEFGYTDVRDADFSQCKTLLSSELNESPLLFYFTRNPKRL